MDERQSDATWSSARPDPAVASIRAKALSSPIRWQILRLCLQTPRTNKELAEHLGLNPGSMLHHVRTLVSAGYLAPQEQRRGARNSVEIPYMATQQMWDTAEQVPQVHAMMADVLGQEFAELPQDGVRFWRLGVRLSDTEVAELGARISSLFEEYSRRASAAENGGRPMSLVASLHPDGVQPARPE